MKTPRFLLILAIMGVSISSCHSQPAAASSPAEVPTSVMLPTVTETPTIIATEAATPISVQFPAIVSPKSCATSNGQLPTLSNPETPLSTRPVHRTLGGGVVQSKEFTIEMLLYCDSAFQPNSADYISDIGGLAIYHNWRYDAPHESGLITGYFGIEPDILWKWGEGPSTSQGHVSQGQSAGICFAANTSPDFSKPTSLTFVYVLQTEFGQLSGAVLSFDAQQVSDGLQPSNILVAPCSDTELQSIKSALPTATP